MIPIFGTPKPPKNRTAGGEKKSHGNTSLDSSIDIARRNIANWAMLPHMQPFLLVDKQVTADLVESVSRDLESQDRPRIKYKPTKIILQFNGFEIHQKFDQPTYRGMFQAAFSRFPHAPAVMFSNGDMMYTPSLHKTIEATMQYVERKAKESDKVKGNQTRGWMIIGQRFGLDMPSKWSTLNNSHWEEDMEINFAKKAAPYHVFAIDYFIVSRNLFDWWNNASVPDFVVGGILFDNWIVDRACRMAREGQTIVVEATNTIFALHQNHGVNHPHPKNQHNLKLASRIVYGSTTHALLATELDHDGNVRIFDRARTLR